MAVLWACTAAGITIEAFYKDRWWKSRVSLCLYLGMGWFVVGKISLILETFPKNAVYLLLAGGLGYTGGVPFFVRNRGLDHMIWHLWVIAGSLFHWVCVYVYVLDMDKKQSQ